MKDSELVIILCRAIEYILSPQILAFPGAQICRTLTQSTLHYYSEYDPGEIIYMDARAGMISKQQTNSNSNINKDK